VRLRLRRSTKSVGAGKQRTGLQRSAAAAVVVRGCVCVLCVWGGVLDLRFDYDVGDSNRDLRDHA